MSQLILDLSIWWSRVPHRVTTNPPSTAPATWQNPANWGSGAPSSSDTNTDVDNSTGSSQLVISGTTASSAPSSLSINNLTISGPDGTANSVTLDSTASSSVPLAIADQLTVGANGTLNINGGAVTAADADFGTTSTGTGNQSAGTLTVSGDMHLGRDDGGNGSYTLSGGTLAVGAPNTSGRLSPASIPIGTFTQTGGTHTVGNQLEVGGQDTGAGCI